LLEIIDICTNGFMYAVGWQWYIFLYGGVHYSECNTSNTRCLIKS